MAEEPVVNPFDEIGEKFGIKTEDELASVIDRAGKMDELETKYDHQRAEFKEFKKTHEDLEASHALILEDQRVRNIADARVKVQTAFVPGLWEGDTEVETDDGKTEVPTADLLAEAYVKDPAGFYLEHKQFALAEMPNATRQLQGSAGSPGAEDVFEERRKAANAVRTRSGA